MRTKSSSKNNFLRHRSPRPLWAYGGTMKFLCSINAPQGGRTTAISGSNFQTRTKTARSNQPHSLLVILEEPFLALGKILGAEVCHKFRGSSFQDDNEGTAGKIFRIRKHFVSSSKKPLLIWALLTLLACAQSNFPPNHLFRPTSAETVSSPLVFDCNRDGRKEIVIGSFDGNCFVLDDSLRDFPGWPQSARGGFFSSPTLWDIDRDNVPEIFIGSNEGMLHGWRFDGSNANGFPIRLEKQIWSSPVIIADSLIAIGGEEKMFVFERNGNAATGWPQEIRGWAAASAAWSQEVIAITTLTRGETSRGYLYAWHLDGRLYEGFPLHLKMDSDSSPSLADLDKDGAVEIILGDDAGLLHAFRLEGNELPNFPRLIGEAVQASPAIADINDDGVLDIVIGTTDGALHVWNALGDCVLGWPVRLGGGEINGSAAIVRIANGETRIVIGGGNEKLYAFDAAGKLAEGFPFACEDAIFSSPLVEDLDNSGMLDIVFGANNGIHVIKDQWSAYRGERKSAWPMFRQNAQRTGVFE